MQVKKLKEIIKDLSDDTEIVIEGEYGRGLDVTDIVIDKRVYDDNYYDKDEKRQQQKVLILKIDSYLAENEDLGEMQLWLTKSEYDDTYYNNIQQNDIDEITNEE